LLYEDLSSGLKTSGRSERLAKPVVFFYILTDFPGARLAGWKGGQIAFTYFNRFSNPGSNHDIIFKELAGFLLTITPGKLRNFLGPDRPFSHTDFFNWFSSGLCMTFILSMDALG